MNPESQNSHFRLHAIPKLLTLLFIAFHLFLFLQAPGAITSPQAWGYLCGKVCFAILVCYGAARLCWWISRRAFRLTSLVYVLILLLLVSSDIISILKRGVNLKKEKEIVLNFLNETKNDWEKINADYQRSIVELRAETLLEPKRLVEDKELRDSEILLAKLRKADLEFKQKVTAKLEGTEQAMSSLPIAETTKAQMIGGFREGKADKENGYRELFRLNSEIYDHAQNIFNLMKSNPAGYRYENGSIAFLQDKDLKIYNSEIIQIQESAAKLTEMATKSQKQVQKTMEDLTEKLKD